MKALKIEPAARTNGELLSQLVVMKFETELDNQRKALLIKQIEACNEL